MLNCRHSASTTPPHNVSRRLRTKDHIAIVIAIAERVIVTAIVLVQQNAVPARQIALPVQQIVVLVKQNAVLVQQNAVHEQLAQADKGSTISAS